MSPSTNSTKEFSAFLASFQTDAASQGLARSTLDAAFKGLEPDPEVLSLASSQPELVKTAGEYVKLLVSDVRLELGRQKLREYRSILTAVETSYGVDGHVVLAIWGIESNYGGAPGTRGVIRSLATLAAYEPRRPAFWRAELVAALRILASGDMSSDTMAGSWAGAMGHTQFMPTTYAMHSVDFDKDGRRDIWNSIPDALASTANYLKASGWVAGVPWGFEVTLRDGFDLALSAPGVAKSWTEWQALGVALTVPRQMPGNAGSLQMLLPAGASGPALLVSNNFKVILRYNNAQSYAISVGHLADRLSSGQPYAKAWPADDRALSREDREELQRRLTGLGFATGGVDGVVGVGTKAAARLFQRARGLPEDGHAGLALLERLRQEGSR